MFHLSKQLSGHKGDVRCACILKNNRLVTGGLDGMCIVWTNLNLGDEPGKIEIHPNCGFIYAVCAHPLNPDWFLCAGKDRRVLVFDSITGQENLQLDSIAVHTGPISSVAVRKSRAVVGSWDGSFSVWSLETGELQRHIKNAGSHAITVAITESGEIITASQDKSIKFWSFESEKMKFEIPNAHSEIIRGIDVNPLTSGVILTCSNDCTIKIWIDKNPVGELVGHENFIYSVSSCNNLCASASEDKTARIWSIDPVSGIPLQTIQHPGTVWFSQFLECPSPDKIVTGCSDGIVRIFSTRECDRASLDEIEAFHAVIAASTSKSETQIDPATVPLETSLFRYRGNTPGEIKMFKDVSDTVFAYQWTAEGTWEKLGQVTGTTKSLEKKSFVGGDQYFPSGQYDYVFDVDLGGGRMALLPFNKGDNILVTAEKFCAREAINKSNIPQITDFIRSNAPNSNSNSESVSVSESKHFPLSNPILFKEAKWPQLLAKLKEGAASVLSEEELQQIEHVVKLLQEPPSHANRDFRPIEISTIHTKLVSVIPSEYLFAVFDLWRLFALHKAAAVMYKDSDQGFQYMATAARQLEANIANNTGLCAARYLANLFSTSVSKWAAVDRYLVYLPVVKLALSSSESCPKGTQIACAAVLANLGTSTTEKKSEKSIKIANDLIQVILQLLGKSNILDPDALHKLLVALGSSVIGSGGPNSSPFKQEISSAIECIRARGGDDQIDVIKQICADILKL